MFHGRRDHQIKTRGYRGELGEIESALHSHADVPRPSGSGPDPRWATACAPCWCSVRTAGDSGSSGPLRSDASRYMFRFMEFRDALPRTASGKVDRAALAAESPAERKDPV